uniref:Uncharacterized protein n=1 Tax=Molossus molossus TaxID=27622 RepID=A0A7J8BL84_MOLMO|nr:hypothetical protein HJG59_010154 [Molossus molossus]
MSLVLDMLGFLVLVGLPVGAVPWAIGGASLRLQGRHGLHIIEFGVISLKMWLKVKKMNLSWEGVESKRMMKRHHLRGAGQCCHQLSSPQVCKLNGRSIQHPNPESCSPRVCQGPKGHSKPCGTVVYTLEMIWFC